MNIVSKTWKKSEVEENKEKVVVGARLIYSDACNFQRYTVVSVEDDVVELIDSEGGTDYICLNGLQIGWEFSTQENEP